MKKEILFVTSSKNKIVEIEKTLNGRFVISPVSVDDLYELQSLDVMEVAKHKLGMAVESLMPSQEQYVMVEDTAFHVDVLGGLPGPFIKYFNDSVKPAGIYTMAQSIAGDGEKIRATAQTVIGLHKNGNDIFFLGEIHGHIVPDVLDKDRGWGFDKIFIPDGHDVVLGELENIKAQISHRARATKKFADYLLTQ